MLVAKNPPANAGDLRDGVLISGLGRSPGGGYGNPLQYSCLENPTDRGILWATIHRVAESQTRLKWLSMHARRCILYCLPYMVCPTCITNGQRSCSKTEATWAFQRNEIDVGIRRKILLFPPGITSCRNVAWGTSGVPNGHLGYQLERMQKWGQLPWESSQHIYWR